MFSDIRPTTKRRLSNMATYAVAIILIAALVFFADWDKLGKLFLNTEVIGKLFPNVVIIALRNTILYTLISFAVGTVIATVLALLKMSKGPLSWFAKAYIELFRGLPALLVIFFMAFGIPLAFKGANLDSLTAGLIGLIFVTSAYTAEIIRSGIEAVPKGQTEAARSLGMPALTTSIWVILPQAFRIVIPPLTNEFVLLLKDTSLLYIAGSTIQTRELTSFARDGLTTFASPTPLIVAAVLYLIVTLPLTWLVGRLEKKLAVKK